MLIRSVAEFLALTGPNAPRQVERDLITACQNGNPLKLGPPPKAGKPDPKRHVRAELIQLLATGGTAACGISHRGLWLEGAHITGSLNLRYAKPLGGLSLNFCRFDRKPDFTCGEFQNVSLTGSSLPGLDANALNIKGALWIDKVTSLGTISLAGSAVKGQLTCSLSTFDGRGGDALNGSGLSVGGSAILRGFTAFGTVDLAGCTVGGQMDFEGAKLDGGEGRALFAQRMQVSEGLVFRNLQVVRGVVFMAAAQVGDLMDDQESWPVAPDELYLDGFTYDRIGGLHLPPVTFADRKDWLARGSRYQSRCHPQPYTQFAKVLREAGNAGEARKVLAERDRLVFQEVHRANGTALDLARQGRGDVGRAWLRLWLTQVWDWFTRVFSGYGHAPHYALFWSLGLVGVGAVWFFVAWQAGVMVPNSPVIMTSDEWRSAVAASPLAPSHDWVANAAAATHYETFYSLPFALDTYAPLVSLGQEEAWAATTTTTFGKVTRWFTFAFKIAGWAISALGLAAITGFVQKNQPD